MKSMKQKGYVNSWMIMAIGAFVLFLIAGGFAIWSFMEYSQTKNGVDARVQVETAKAKAEQAEDDQRKFLEETKKLLIEFVGPSEYGRVSFMYPKIWSVYIDRDGSDRGDYVAYLHPKEVPSIHNKDSRFAMRLEIINKDFNTVLKNYEQKVKKGELSSSSVEFNGIAATRIDGALSKELRGTVVLMKVNDKTIRFSTDADTFKPDFEAVLKTLKIAG